jgi:hypothetical protein
MKAIAEQYLLQSVQEPQSIGTISQMLKGYTLSGEMTVALYDILLQQAQASMGSAASAVRTVGNVLDGYLAPEEDEMLVRRQRLQRHHAFMAKITLQEERGGGVHVWTGMKGAEGRQGGSGHGGGEDGEGLIADVLPAVSGGGAGAVASEGDDGCAVAAGADAAGSDPASGGDWGDASIVDPLCAAVFGHASASDAACAAKWSGVPGPDSARHAESQAQGQIAADEVMAKDGTEEGPGGLLWSQLPPSSPVLTSGRVSVVTRRTASGHVAAPPTNSGVPTSARGPVTANKSGASRIGRAPPSGDNTSGGGQKPAGRVVEPPVLAHGAPPVDSETPCLGGVPQPGRPDPLTEGPEGSPHHSPRGGFSSNGGEHWSAAHEWGWAGPDGGWGEAEESEARAVFQGGTRQRRQQLEQSPFFREVCSTLREMGQPAGVPVATADGLVCDVAVAVAGRPVGLQLIGREQTIAVAPRGQVCCTPSIWTATPGQGAAGAYASDRVRGGILCWQCDGAAAWYAGVLRRSLAAVFVVMEVDWEQWDDAARRAALHACLSAAPAPPPVFPALRW